MSLSELRLHVKDIAKRNIRNRKAGNQPAKKLKSGGTMPVKFPRYLQASLIGKARTLMMLTLSQAPRNGNDALQSLLVTIKT